MTFLNQIHENDSSLKDPLFQTKQKLSKGRKRGGETIQYYLGSVLLYFYRVFNQQAKEKNNLSKNMLEGKQLLNLG